MDLKQLKTFLGLAGSRGGRMEVGRVLAAAANPPQI